MSSEGPPGDSSTHKQQGTEQKPCQMPSPTDNTLDQGPVVAEPDFHPTLLTSSPDFDEVPLVSTSDNEGDTTALDSGEEALLADFDRYIRTDDLPSSSHASAPSPTPVRPSVVPVPVDSLSAGLHRLVRLFPNADSDVLNSVLTSCEGDENAAIIMLGGPAPPTREDERLAVRLQKHEERRAGARQGGRRSETRHRRNDAVVGVHKGVMEQMVSTLREIVVPALRAHFQELVLPDMHDRSGSVEYALRDFQVSGLAMPADGIVVKTSADGQSVRVNVINVFLELEVGKWRYESKGFLPMEDSGSARVTVHGMSVALRLEPRWSHSGGTNVVIADCSVIIDGAVRFKVHGASADWAYNAIAVVLKPLVVSYVKEAVASTVTTTLAVHLRQWEFAHRLDETPASEHRILEDAPATPPRQRPSGGAHTSVTAGVE